MPLDNFLESSPKTGRIAVVVSFARFSTLPQRDSSYGLCVQVDGARAAVRRHAARAVKRCFQPITANAVAPRNRGFFLFFLLVREPPKRVSLAPVVVRQFITNRRGRHGKRGASVFTGVIALEKTCQKLFGDSSRRRPGHGGRFFSSFFFLLATIFFSLRFSRSFVLPLNANPLSSRPLNTVSSPGAVDQSTCTPKHHVRPAVLPFPITCTGFNERFP